MRVRSVVAVGVAAMVAMALGGCSLLNAHTSAESAPARSGASTPATEPTVSGAPAVPTFTPSPNSSATPTAAPDPAQSHLATPEPVATPEPAPTLVPVPAGTVVAQGDVASPKGSIHYHYRVVANGNNTFTAQYSGFTSTVPIPVSVTLLTIPPKVGDGLTYHGIGDHLLGGPTTTPTASSTTLGSVSQPQPLVALVTYSSVASDNGLPVELGPNKVLAVNTVQWNVPVRQSNVHPVDHGARSYAAGKVTARTSSGAPKSYLIAPGDITSVVAARFGISVTDLIWLNTGLEVFGDQQYLYEGTTLNLDPNSL